MIPEVEVDELLHREEVLRLRDHGHGELVLQGARLLLVERGLAGQDGLPALDGLHGAHGEAPPIPRAVHLVQHRNLRVPCERKPRNETKFMMLDTLLDVVNEGKWSFRNVSVCSHLSVS